MLRPTLHELGIHHHTDKAVYHLFTVIYDTWFSKLRDEQIRLLEIGVLLGGSLRMWEEYFPNAELHGADIDDRSEYATSRIRIHQTDQTKSDQLQLLPRDCHIIVDDGGHTMLQQQLTLTTLFESHLLPGGTYILEDLHTSEVEYYPKWADYGSNTRNNTLKLLEDLQRGILSENNEYYISGADFCRLRDQIAFIEIVRVKADSVTSRIVKKT
jgi:hypothetical protein